MVTRLVRIGSLKNVHKYDDGDYSEAMDTDDQPIKIGQSTDPSHAIRQDQMPTAGKIISSDAVISDHAVVRGDGGTREVQDSDVGIDDNGSINIPTGESYKVNSVQVVTNQQAAEADLAATPDLTGADTVDQTDLESYLSDIKTKLNSVLAKLRTHGLIDT